MMKKSKKYVLFGLLVVILATIMVWIISIIKGELPYIDQWTRSFVMTVADTSIYTMARWITELGSEPFIISFTVIMSFIIWWMFRDWLPAIIFSGGTLGSHLLNMLIKRLVARERPSIFIEANAEGFSFPSGHSMITMVCYGFLMYLLVKKLTSSKAIMWLQLIFSVLIFLIGISRYIINVHYLTDIIAGFTFGFIFLLSLIYLYEFIQRQRLNNAQS